MKLKSIYIKNFKGIDEMNVAVSDGGVKISGRNGSGKTTIADAFFWAMTGRNYAGMTDGKGGFKVQNINAAEPADAMVEIEFADGTRFGKTLTSKGKLQYSVNGVEFQAKEYDAYIAENIAADVALLSNPNHFAGLSWQDQRALVSALAPVQLAELTSNAELVAEMTTKDIETWRKSVKKSIETAKAGIAKTDTEIQTIAGLMPDIAGVDEAKTKIAEIDTEIARLQGDMQNAMSNDADAVKLANMRVEIQKFINENKAKINTLESDKNAVESELHTEFAASQRAIDDVDAEIKRKESAVADLRKRFDQRAAEMYPDDGDEIRCPLNKEHNCADAVLSEIVKNNKRNIIAKFYEQKEADLNAIESDGKLLNAQIAEKKEQRAQLIQQRDAKHRELNEKAGKLIEKIETIRKSLNDKYIEMQSEVDKFAADIEKSDATAGIQVVKNKIAELSARRDELTEIVSRKKLADKYAADIESKKAEIENIKKEMENAMAKLSEGEGLIDAHAAEIERRVNAMFDNVKFQMFETLKNGTRQNACTIAIGGVPYGRGANNAAEVNAGIEICAAFQNHFNIDMPIFVDNAESVNEINGRGRQVVALYVNTEPISIQ